MSRLRASNTSRGRMIKDRESRSSILYSRSSTPIEFATAAVVSDGLVSDFAVVVLVLAAGVVPVAVADVVPLAAVAPAAVVGVGLVAVAAELVVAPVLTAVAADAQIAAGVAAAVRPDAVAVVAAGAPRSAAASAGVVAVVVLGHLSGYARCLLLSAALAVARGAALADFRADRVYSRHPALQSAAVGQFRPKASWRWPSGFPEWPLERFRFRRRSRGAAPRTRLPHRRLAYEKNRRIGRSGAPFSNQPLARPPASQWARRVRCSRRF